MEFLGFLAEDSPGEGESSRESRARAMADVLERHLSPWATETSKRLAKREALAFYLQVVEALPPSAPAGRLAGLRTAESPSARAAMGETCPRPSRVNHPIRVGRGHHFRPEPVAGERGFGAVPASLTMSEGEKTVTSAISTSSPERLDRLTRAQVEGTTWASSWAGQSVPINVPSWGGRRRPDPFRACPRR